MFFINFSQIVQKSSSRDKVLKRLEQQTNQKSNRNKRFPWSKASRSHSQVQHAAIPERRKH